MSFLEPNAIYRQRFDRFNLKKKASFSELKLKFQIKRFTDE